MLNRADICFINFAKPMSTKLLYLFLSIQFWQIYFNLVVESTCKHLSYSI